MIHDLLPTLCSGLIIIVVLTPLVAAPKIPKGKVTMYQNLSDEPLEVTSKDCHSGIFHKEPVVYSCACVTGVWGFYPKLCDKPTLFVGGDSYCFRTDNVSLSQVAIVGSFRYPFSTSLSHFNGAFMQLTNVYTDEEHTTAVDAGGSWITITHSPWTLYGDRGDTICLQPTGTDIRMYCLFNVKLDAALDDTRWRLVVEVKKGCHSSTSVEADACYNIVPPNDKSGCKEYPTVVPIPPKCDPERNTTDDFNTTCGWVNITGILKPPTTPKPGTVWIPFPTTTGRPTTSPKPGNNATGPPSNESEEVWIPVLRPPTTTPPPKCDELTRDSVKKYWLDPANNECAKSINEAVFTDQLRRFAVTRQDTIFDSRLHSLSQMSQLLFRSRDIMKITCDKVYVPTAFFDVAGDAFNMFMQEDFFYGVEGIDSVTFDRILKSLAKCRKRARLYVFENKPLGCDLRKIQGTLILEGSKVNLSIPDIGKSKHYEPLIETAWKIFLNAHSYCFEDFQFPNDHHHFGVLFLELFSRSIYEKWIEPLRNKNLYKFIIPNFELLAHIMENMDYCVAATNQLSKCPAWLSRSNPSAKSVVISVGAPSSSRRKKRSVWLDRINLARDRSKIWNGTAHCVQHMEEPSTNLGYFSLCNQVF